MQFWLQRFNIRPKLERGFLWAGRLLTITVIPIYFLALVGVLPNRRVTFKTTPKGNARGEEIAEDELNVFKPHLVLTALILAGMASASCEATPPGCSSPGAGLPRSCCRSSRFPACAGGWLVRCAGSGLGLASLNPSLNRRHVCFALLRWLSKANGG
jgi:hypothetical protein